MSEHILEIRDLTVDFGGVRAVNKVSFALKPGEFVGLIGPNGAGKTTVFNLITNAVRATSGAIVFKGKSILGKKPDQICRLGISRTFQNIRLFPQMTAYENVELGLHSTPRYSIFEAFVRTRHARNIESKTRARKLTSCWNWWTWKNTPTSGPPACPTACSAGLKSHAPWPPTPTCCCLTNRLPG